MARATLDPAEAFGRHPLQPHQLLDRVTRTEDTIVLCHLGVPRIDADDWSLSVDGLVRRPARVTLSELMQRTRSEITSIHQCCGSPLRPDMPTRRVCNVVWSGVRLSDLLADCEPEPAARYVWSSGADYGTFEGDAIDAFVKDLPLERVAADVLIRVRDERFAPVARERLSGAIGRAGVLRNEQRQMAEPADARTQACDRAVHDALVQ